MGLRTRRARRSRFTSVLFSLVTGTIMVVASVFYDRAVEAKTQAAFASHIVTRGTVLAKGIEPFSSLIETLVLQDAPLSHLVLPREYLKLRAQEEGVGYETLNRIAYCESKWRMVGNASSSAYGYFQIISGTEKATPQYKAGGRKEDPYANIDMAIFLYQSDGTKPWEASRECWANR